MATNPNTKLANQHMQFLANSGFGKSQTLRTQSLIPERCRLIKWDNNDDHVSDDEARTSSLAQFFRYLAAAERSGKASYEIAYNGDAAPHIFEQFCRGVWSILDGSKPTYLLIEEYSDCCPGAGPLDYKKDFYHRKLWTQGRKYGLVIATTSQRPQLISKDSLGCTGVVWASNMDIDAATRIGKSIGVHYSELMALQVGEFYRRQMGKPAEKLRLFTPS